MPVRDSPAVFGSRSNFRSIRRVADVTAVRFGAAVQMSAKSWNARGVQWTW